MCFGKQLCIHTHCVEHQKTIFLLLPSKWSSYLWQIEKRERYDRGRGPNVQARDKKKEHKEEQEDGVA
jgi:hypothetical protein